MDLHLFLKQEKKKEDLWKTATEILTEGWGGVGEAHRKQAIV